MQPVVDPIVFQLSIFVLAIFVVYYVVWSVTPALHTPLMSVTNAVSSVIIVGALLAAAAQVAPGDHRVWISKGAGAVAAGLASVNIFGGFLVTQRMLAMRPRVVRLLNGSGLFFTGLGLIQASIWVRDAAPGGAWFNAELAIAALCLAVVAQSVSALRNRKAWDGVDRRATAIGEGA